MLLSAVVHGNLRSMKVKLFISGLQMVMMMTRRDILMMKFSVR